MTEVFPRTLEQRMGALAKANRHRVYRAELKRNLKAGASVVPVLTDPSPEIETMKVFALLCAVPGYGRVKAARLLNHHRVAQSRTVGGLSDRQRAELIEALA